jgi:hypothetical protein
MGSHLSAEKISEKISEIHLQLFVADWAECDGDAVVGHVVHQDTVLQAAYAVVDALCP